MSISTPRPPAPPQKRGLGCFGCGCLVLVILVILFFALMGGAGYFGYKKALGLTSTAPANLPAATTPDSTFQTTWQKLADFDHDLKDHQPATIKLGADEINAIIAREPNFAKNNVRALVTFTGDEGQIQASVPTSLLAPSMMKLPQDRYFNVTTSFAVGFDSSTKGVTVTLHSLQCGDNVVFSSSSGNQQVVQLYANFLNQSLNTQIRKDPDGALLLDQAKTVEIHNGQLVIETQ